jgi:micrococcal nuclease
MKFVALLFGLALVVPAHAHKIIAVSTGDTLTLQVDEKPLKVRLANIDAPERGQPFAQRSKQSLSELCLGKEASFKEQDIDHGLVVAIVTCGDVEASSAQVERGMAWVYTKYNKDLTLPGLEAMARRDRRGLWMDAEPVAPWEFRKPQNRKAGSALPKNSAEGICYVDQRGEYRIVDGRKRYGC